MSEIKIYVNSEKFRGDLLPLSLSLYPHPFALLSLLPSLCSPLTPATANA
jgi:hypothetical protein